MARGKPRETAILVAALRVLQEQGYAAMTMDAVATAARASKATIYRRWANKAELLKAALDTLDSDQAAAVPDTGELRRDLVAVMNALREKASQPYVDAMRELVAAVKHDYALAKLLQVHQQAEELSPFHHVIRRAIRRGELPRSTDARLIHDVAEALILRQLQLGLRFDAAFVARVVGRVLLPLLTPRRPT
jgi:AcrR family transcriptional regulator